ncbi:MAG TPA: PDZ domain-containing protein, partial [Thermoleophilia bacterium]|nr:PDZ domain-containing protein [Thermoleophilia bacterium]
ADRAGLLRGDIIVAFEDQPVPDVDGLQRRLAELPSDGERRLTILRSNQRLELSVRPAASSAEAAER